MESIKYIIALIFGGAFVKVISDWIARRYSNRLNSKQNEADKAADLLKAEIQAIEAQRKELEVKDLTLEEELEYWKRNKK